MEAAIWLRVSTDQQESANQLPALERFCAHHGHTITARYTVSGSAWNGGRDGGEYRATLAAAMDDAYRGRYKVLVVWAADRISRGGIEDLLRIARQLRERGATLMSVQEPWLNGSDATTELMSAIAAWVAQQESARRSERVRAGLARRKASGLPVGRLAGAHDARPRRTAGYVGNRNAAAR